MNIANIIVYFCNINRIFIQKNRRGEQVFRVV